MNEKEIIDQIRDKLYEVQDLMRQLGELGFDAYCASIDRFASKNASKWEERSSCAKLGISTGIVELRESIGGDYKAISQYGDLVINGLDVYQLAEISENCTFKSKGEKR